VIRKKCEDARLRIGIDIGGTKTHLALEEDGALDHRVVATSAWQRDGLFGAGNVPRLVDLFLADVPDPASTPLAIGAHGCDSAEQVERFDALVRRQWPGPLRVVNDAELLAPAAGLTEAICLIVGTGSIVIGRDLDGAPVYVGGHGWLLDDFGSAPGITREAVRAVLRAADEGQPPDGLARSLMDRFGAEHEVDLSLRFTAAADIAVWAEPAPVVFECADSGSATAVTVIEEAADRLSRDVLLARARGAVGTTVVAAGGVVTNQPRLLDSIARRLSSSAPELRVELLTVAPVVGALEMARRLDRPAPGHPRPPHPLEHPQPVTSPVTSPVTNNRGGTR
jgi:glucosamine kinase